MQAVGWAGSHVSAVEAGGGLGTDHTMPCVCRAGEPLQGGPSRDVALEQDLSCGRAEQRVASGEGYPFTRLALAKGQSSCCCQLGAVVERGAALYTGYFQPTAQLRPWRLIAGAEKMVPQVP